MLTEEFYAECHKVVLAGIRKGWIVFPPLEKPTQKEVAKFRAEKPCAVCSSMISMHSPWQKMCYPCSITTARKRDRLRREKSKLKIEIQNRNSNFKFKNEKAKTKRKAS